MFTFLAILADILQIIGLGGTFLFITQLARTTLYLPRVTPASTVTLSLIIILPLESMAYEQEEYPVP